MPTLNSTAPPTDLKASRDYFVALSGPPAASALSNIMSNTKAWVYNIMDFLQSPVSPSPCPQCRQITASLSGVRHLIAFTACSDKSRGESYFRLSFNSTVPIYSR